MAEQSPPKQNSMATEGKEKERDGGRLDGLRATGWLLGVQLLLETWPGKQLRVNTHESGGKTVDRRRQARRVLPAMSL